MYQCKEPGGLNLLDAWLQLVSVCGIYGMPGARICLEGYLHGLHALPCMLLENYAAADWVDAGELILSGYGALICMDCAITSACCLRYS